MDGPSGECTDKVWPMFIAGLGDVHGHWREAMTLVISACAKAGISTSDLAAIFQAGDAEPLRTDDEIAQVPGPKKFRTLGDFPEILSGELVVPAPVYFIEGNHEPFVALSTNGGLVAGAEPWGPGRHLPWTSGSACH